MSSKQQNLQIPIIQQDFCKVISTYTQQYSTLHIVARPIVYYYKKCPVRVIFKHKVHKNGYRRRSCTARTAIIHHIYTLTLNVQQKRIMHLLYRPPVINPCSERRSLDANRLSMLTRQQTIHKILTSSYTINTCLIHSRFSGYFKNNPNKHKK